MISKSGREPALMNLCLFVALLSQPAADEPPPPAPLPDITELSLDDLLNVQTFVATKTSTTMRDSPAVITIVTREEIVNSGARDLIDVLNLVGGFAFASDVNGVVGVGFRGNWGHEGKILLLVDGQTVNEGL